MKTLTLSPHLLTLVRDYGTRKAIAWLEGNEDLAIADDDLTSFLSRHDVEFDQLTESDRDALRDEYLEAVKSTMSSRYTPPDSTQEPAEASLSSKWARKLVLTADALEPISATKARLPIRVGPLTLPHQRSL
jgi:hypothetical protein